MLLKAILAKQQTSLKGILYGWGYGNLGTIGDGTQTSKSTPVQIQSTLSWKQLTAGWYNAGGIKSDGSLWVWGENNYGQLGQGYSSAIFSSPVLSTSGTSYSKISSAYHILAIKSDGTLWAWGSNSNAQLGILSITPTISPVLVSGPAGASWSYVAAGRTNSYGITTDGRLYAWGYGLFGALGDLSTTTKSSPVLVSGPANTSWSLVTAGAYFALAITSQGRLYAWGRNLVGALGDNTTVDKSGPILVSGPAATSWSVIAGGQYHSLGITSQGRLYAWGGNGGIGALGNLSTLDAPAPVLVSGPASTSWVAIAAGGDHSYGITSIGRLYAWGGAYYGKLGDLTTTNKSSPVLVSGPASTSWSLVASANGTGFAISTIGRLYAWGRNSNGQLGDNTLVDKSSPVLVSGPASTSWNIVTSNANTDAAVALTNNNVYSWGANQGIFATGASSPIQVGSSSWTIVDTGTARSFLAITTEGRLYAWGYNFAGQVGDLTTIDKYSPVLVSGPANTSWSAIAGGTTSYGITNQGRLYAWGYNFNGELGDLTTVYKSSPVLVSGPANTSWAVVAQYGKAITTQGRLYAWGVNSSGQVGDLTTVNKFSPVLVSGPTATSWIAVNGADAVIGITSLGRLYAWGYNAYGQLGDLTTVNKSSPVLVSGPSNTSWSIAKASNDRFSLAITTSGRLYAWGYNSNGELGDNTKVNKSSPVLVSGPASTSWSLVASSVENSFAVTSLT